MSLQHVVKLNADEVLAQLRDRGLSTSGLESECRERLIAHYLGANKKEEAVVNTEALHAASKKPTHHIRQKQHDEAKQQRGAIESERALADFKASFQANEVEMQTSDGRRQMMKAFVRGDTLVPTNSTVVEPEQEQSTRQPSMFELAASESAVSETAVHQAVLGAFADSESSSATTKSTKSKKRSAMDELKEELAQRQRKRDERGLTTKEASNELVHEQLLRRQAGGGGAGAQTATSGLGRSAAQGGPGSWDDGNPETTNLFMGNLAPIVREDTLFRLFRRYGAVTSVKIMWPRTPEEFSRGHNSAFVAYAERDDAARALDALSELDVFGYQLKINWGKAVATAPGAHVHYEQLQAVAGAAVATHNSAVIAQGRVPAPEPVFVLPPFDAALQAVIDACAVMVAEHGVSFERALAAREHDNPTYNFLRVPSLPDSQYYRWRVYSLARGDSLRRWRSEPFQMYEGGLLWYPPPRLPSSLAAAGGSGDSKRSRRRSPSPSSHGTLASAGSAAQAVLAARERDTLESMLRALTAERAAIGDVMAFALDHSDKAHDVAQTIAESLTIAETLLPVKLARLYAVSDILHNTSNVSVSNASFYRSAFERELPRVLLSFNEALRALSSRIAAHNLRERVLKVLRIWQSWSLFSELFIAGLRSTFLLDADDAPTAQAVASTPAAATAMAIDDLDGAPLDADLDGAPLDLDGVAIDDDALAAVTRAPGASNVLDELSALDSMDDRQLAIKCRASGVPVGERTDMLRRLRVAHTQAAALAAATAAAAAAAASAGATTTTESIDAPTNARSRK